MYLDEARLQKNDKATCWVLMLLTSYYYGQMDKDSVFVFGEEAVHLSRQRQQYDYMFSAMRILIKRYQTQGQLVTALRKAQDGYAEAKALQEDFAMSEIVGVIGSIYFTLEQYEEALRYFRKVSNCF
jgi:tetratricopeptide (TPR) repeat protein